MTEEEAFNSVVHLLLDENTQDGVRDILRSYGDSRERAGIERAAKECDDVGERTMASLIRDLSVPAPASQEPER